MNTKRQNKTGQPWQADRQMLGALNGKIRSFEIMHGKQSEINPSRVVAVIRPAAANCNAPAVPLIEGEMTPRLATILAELCSVGAMVSADRLVKHHMLQATAELFNARAALERATQRKGAA